MASTSTNILRGLNFVLPTVGTAVSAVAAFFPGDDNRVKKIRQSKAIALNKKVQGYSAVAVMSSTIACAALMPIFNDLYQGHSNNINHDFNDYMKGFDNIGPEDVNSMVLLCVLAFVVLPWLQKFVIRYLTYNSEIEVKVIDKRIKELDTENARFNELLKDMQSIILEKSGLTHEAALNSEPTTPDLKIYRIISLHLDPSSDIEDLLRHSSNPSFDNRLSSSNLQENWKALCSANPRPGTELLQLQKHIAGNKEEIKKLRNALKKMDFISSDNLKFGLFGMNGLDENPNSEEYLYVGSYDEEGNLIQEETNEESQGENEEQRQQKSQGGREESQDGSEESQEYSQAPSYRG